MPVTGSENKPAKRIELLDNTRVTDDTGSVLWVEFWHNAPFYRTRKNQNLSANLRIWVGPIKAGDPKKSAHCIVNSV